MNYEVVIGLEVHAQLLTEAKLFSHSSAIYGGEPNTRTDPVILGLPGILPVINRQAIIYAIKMGLATNCQITPFTRFARKHYFYPDLPKGYQISQYEQPICEHGHVEIKLEDDATKRIGLTRIHLEEDAGKSIHDPALAGSDTLVDLNRSGVPLIEIVSEPDIRSPQEAYAYLSILKQLVTYLEICDGNMEEGSLRCDANISLRPIGAKEFGTKTELKNMNSFRNVERALIYEINRQHQILSDGGTVHQETLLWDANSNVARTMRTKEGAQDYRYLPEPDLPPLRISQDWIDEIRLSLPELPADRKLRFIDEFQLPEYDAAILTNEKQLADYYEVLVSHCEDAKQASNWMMVEVLRVLKELKISISEFTISAEDMGELLRLIEKKTVSASMAKTVFEEMLSSGEKAAKIVEDKGLAQISDEGLIEKIVDDVIAANPDQVQQFKEGNNKVISFLIGQVMKLSKGKANPKLASELFRDKLGASGG